jgi:hypothetical protein
VQSSVQSPEAFDEKYYHNLADQYVNSEPCDYGYHKEEVRKDIRDAFLAGAALREPVLKSPSLVNDELLQALKDIVNSITMPQPPHPLFEMVERAEAAIAKASKQNEK